MTHARPLLAVRRSIAMPSRVERVGWLVLAVLACVLAHEATYQLMYGGGSYRAAMTLLGHDGYWLGLSLGVAVATSALVAVVAVAIRNPGVAAIYHNLASTLDADGTLYRVDVPEGAGEWPRLDVAIFLLRRGSTLLAVGESHRPNARFRLTADPGELVRGGQSLAVVAPDRPKIPWHEL